ncbi:MAG: elongation factor P [Planctomycetota bacterium]
MGSSFNVGDLRKGLKVLIDNAPYLITDTEFMKPGKGQAVYRCKLKNLLTGSMLDRTYRSGDRLDAADIAEATLEYLYNDSRNWIFMNQKTYEQFTIPKENMEDAVPWLKEGSQVNVMFWNDQAISVDAPKQVERTITYCEPAARGNTATNVMKPATLEGGATVHVPAFINTGDIVKVDTRTGEYIERVAKSST